MKDTRNWRTAFYQFVLMYPIHLLPEGNDKHCCLRISSFHINDVQEPVMFGAQQMSLRTTKAVFTALISKEGTYNHQTICAVKNNIQKN